MNIRRYSTEIVEAQFVIYEGRRPSCDFSTGQFMTYPQLIETRCFFTAASLSLRPKNTVRFQFITARLFADVFEKLQGERLKRFFAPDEVLDRSGYVYVDAVPLEREQVVWSLRGSCSLPRCAKSITVGSESLAVELGDKMALLGSDGGLYTYEPDHDFIWSTREPCKGEFREVA